MAFALWRHSLPESGPSLCSGRGLGAMVLAGPEPGQLAAIAGNAEQSNVANTSDVATWQHSDGHH